MPVRLLREGILDSTAVNALSFPAEVFYRRLMSVVDDFGRFDGRAAVLRSRLYPLKIETVREADIPRWIAECEKAGLIALYAVDGAGSSRWIATCETAGLAVPEGSKPYILFHKLGPARAKESKYPEPPPRGAHPFADANGCKQPKADANGRKQTPADVPYSGSGSDSYSGAGAPAGGVAAGPPPHPPPAGGAPTRKRAPPASRPAADTPHRRAVLAFCEAWRGRYGAKYPFAGGKDGKAVAEVLDHLGGDVAAFADVVGRYLADRDEFVAKARHPVSLLRTQLARWLVPGPAPAPQAPPGRNPLLDDTHRFEPRGPGGPKAP